MFENGKRRPEKNGKIEDDRQILDIVDIPARLFFEEQITTAGNLGLAGDARLDSQGLLVIVFIFRDFSQAKCGRGSDQAHAANEAKKSSGNSSIDQRR
jgi:hypothetical protein